MNHKPHVEAYNSTFFYKANLKRRGVIIKHRHELFNVSKKSKLLAIHLTIGACGAETSILFMSAFSGSAISALYTLIFN